MACRVRENILEACGDQKAKGVDTNSYATISIGRISVVEKEPSYMRKIATVTVESSGGTQAQLRVPQVTDFGDAENIRQVIETGYGVLITV